MNKNVPRNIAFYLNQRGLSQRALARLVKVSQPTVHNIVSGKVEGSRYLPEIAHALNCTVEDLESDFLPTESSPRTAPPKPLVSEPNAELYKKGSGIFADEFYPVPVHNAELSAGPGCLPQYDMEIDTIPISLNRLRELGIEPEMAQIVTIYGHSMERTLYDKDQVLVDTSKKRPVTDRIFAFLFEGDLRVKRFLRMLDGTWRIISDNEDKTLYPDEILAGGNMNNIRILGEVKMIVSRML